MVRAPRRSSHREPDSSAIGSAPHRVASARREQAHDDSEEATLAHIQALLARDDLSEEESMALKRHHSARIEAVEDGRERAHDDDDVATLAHIQALLARDDLSEEESMALKRHHFARIEA